MISHAPGNPPATEAKDTTIDPNQSWSTTALSGTDKIHKFWKQRRAAGSLKCFGLDCFESIRNNLGRDFHRHTMKVITSTAQRLTDWNIPH